MTFTGGTNGTATTKANGSWNASLKGSVKVTPTHDDYTFDPTDKTVNKAAANVNFTGTKKTTTPDPTAYTVSGTVKDGTGDPIEGVTLTFTGGTTGSTASKADGTWNASFKGSVKVTPTHDDYTFVPAQATVTKAANDVNFTATATDPGTPEPVTYTASGKVALADGTGIAGVTIHLSSFATTVTGANGEWSQSGLNGFYYVRAAEQPGYTFAPQGHSITLNSGDESGIDFTATPVPLDELRVGQGEQFTTIQEAVNAAKIGDTIIVLPGTYNENVTINKMLTLKGTDPEDEATIDTTVIEGTGDGPVIKVSGAGANGTVIEGLTITGGQDGIEPWGWSGAPIEVTIRHNQIKGNARHGISLSNGEYVIEENRIHGNKEGIYAQSGVGNTTILGNQVTDNTSGGISFPFGSDLASYVEIEDNDVKNNGGTGIRLAFGSNQDVLVADNDIHENEGGGMSVQAYGATVHIQNNNIYGNTTSSYGAGVALSTDSSNVKIMNNEFDRNTATGNGGGLYVFANVGDVVVAYNTFYGNLAASGAAIYVDNTGYNSAVVDEDGWALSPQTGDYTDNGGNEYSANTPDNIHYVQPLL